MKKYTRYIWHILTGFALSLFIMQGSASAAPRDTPGIWALQLGAFNTQETAETAWKQIRSKHEYVLDALSPTYQQIRHDGRILHRLRTGHFTSIRKARAICKMLQDAGSNCYIIKASLPQPAQDNCKDCTAVITSAVSEIYREERSFRFAGGFSVDDRDLLEQEGLLSEQPPPSPKKPLESNTAAPEKPQVKQQAENIVYPPTTTTTTRQSNNKWQPHLDIELRKGNKRNIARAEAFLPLRQDNDTLLFADIRGMTDSAQNQEGNLGLGYRKIIRGGSGRQDWVLGGYGFLDFRHTEANNRFWQATFGLEALSENFDIRSNIYLPEATEKDVPGTARVNGVVVGTQLRLVGFGNIRERALPGFDAEIGYKLPILKDQIDAFKLYGGGYYFDANNYRTVAGPRGRMELQWQNFMDISEDTRFTLGLEVQHDQIRDTSAFAIARLRIPLYNVRHSTKRRLSAIERRMTARVIRDVDIVSVPQKTAASIDELARIQVNGTQITNATLLNATDNVATDAAAAGAGSTVILDGSQGQINLTGSLILQPNQTITGGGIAITGLTSGLVGTIGTRPTLTDTGIAGATATLQGNSVGNDFTIENIDIISDNTGESMDFDGANNLTIRNVTSTGGTNGLSIGIGFGGPEVANALIDNVTISNTSGFGFLQVGSVVNLQDVVVNNAGSTGIATAFGGVFRADRVTINTTTQAGLLSFSATSVDLNNVTVTNAGTNSFEMNSTALSGNDNTSTTPIGLHCNDQGGNTGSFGLNGGTCP